MKNLLIDLAIFVAMTIYAIFYITRGAGRNGFEIGLIVYIFISLRLLARHVSMSKVVYAPLSKGFNATVGAVINAIPQKFRVPILFVIPFAGFIITAVVSPLPEGLTIGNRLQSFAGIIVYLLIMYATSSDRKAIPWHTVGAGLTIQFFVALFVLKTTIGANIFEAISKFVAGFLKFSDAGLSFLFGNVVHNNFVVNVFPAIVFFCSFIYVVYYFGGMQYIVQKLAVFTLAVMDCSGSEAVVAAASPFIGQGESALLVKPFVEFMTKSEIHATMTSGFATIAGSVFAAYISIGADGKLLLTSCVMSIPSSLLLSKMRYPEKEESISKGKVTIPPSREKEANFLHAAGNGAAMGVQIILLIAGAVLCLISLLEAANFVIGFLFSMVDVYDRVSGPQPKLVTLQFCLSYLLYPFAVLMGVQLDQARLAGVIMAEKLILNEFVAFLDLYSPAFQGAFSDRTLQLLNFATCGFANLSSIGIQIGALSAIAPSRSKDFASLAFSAMLTGTISTWITASVAGVLL
ncbi:Na+ dependent nucleoside transporter C-terminus-domain-containing protein [Gorgonomyces haynaldii]|nr:Na+ dependent nucleoside transporter C-terminus-domain-containing protein [Gorgonomyces haynaldii]